MKAQDQYFSKFTQAESVSERAPSRVLLIEDNTIIQRLYQIYLTKLGCEVESIGTGRQALALAEMIYQCIFLDVGLPDMSGLEVAREIRRREQNTQGRTPIIVLTALGIQDFQETCQEIGIDAIMSKLVPLTALSAALQKFCK